MDFSPLTLSLLTTFALFSVPIILSVGLLNYFKKRWVSKRANPLTADLLRPAGHTLQKQINDLQIDLFSQLFVTPLLMMMMALFMMLQSYLLHQKISGVVMSFVGVMLLGLFIHGMTKSYKMMKRLQHLKLGYFCELAVGQELEQIVRPQQSPYRVYHDIPFDGFNIDHLIISPNGVFVIETKGRSKPINDGTKQFKVRVENDALHFPHHVETEPLLQVRRNITSVRNWLNSATGTEVPVGGILVLPGWFVDLRQKATAPYVISGAALPKVLPQLKVGALEQAHIQAIAHQVEQRVRDVAKAG